MSVRRFEWAGTTVALVGLMVALLGVAASDGNFGPRFGRSLAEVDFEAAGSSPGSGLGDGGAQEGGHRLTSGEAALYDSPSSTARLVQDFLPSATHGWRDLNFASLGAVGVKLGWVSGDAAAGSRVHGTAQVTSSLSLFPAAIAFATIALLSLVVHSAVLWRRPARERDDDATCDDGMMVVPAPDGPDGAGAGEVPPAPADLPEGLDVEEEPERSMELADCGRDDLPSATAAFSPALHAVAAPAGPFGEVGASRKARINLINDCQSNGPSSSAGESRVSLYRKSDFGRSW